VVLSRHNRDETNKGEVMEVRDDGSLPHPEYDSLSTNYDFMHSNYFMHLFFS
jgi:hypothetical protein